jgi:hypothetical protein
LSTNDVKEGLPEFHRTMSRGPATSVLTPDIQKQLAILDRALSPPLTPSAK